jgi:hypothetical protein
MEEIWKEIPWYEWLYQVSNYWNIKSFNYKYWIEWKILVNKIRSKKKKYLFVTLCKNTIQKHINIHQLVMLAFIWKSNWLDINHINGIKNDNRLENLEYCTRKENIQHSFRTWLQTVKKWIENALYWNKSPLAKSVSQYDKELNLINIFPCMNLAKRELWLNINSWSISDCCRWIKKSYKWFIWKYS